MKYLFSDQALLTMTVDVGYQKETEFTRQLYDKLRKAYYAFLFKKVKLSDDELNYLFKVCDKGNDTILGRGKEAGIELAKILNKGTR